VAARPPPRREPFNPQTVVARCYRSRRQYPSQVAEEILADLANSRDEEIAEVASETISMAQAMSGETDENVNGDGEWIN